MTIRATLGANVLVSAIPGIANERSTPGDLLRRWRRGVFDLSTSDYVIDEVGRALRGRYYGSRLSIHDVALAVATIEARSLKTGLSVLVLGIAPDPKDDPVIATALSSNSRYLVTGDGKLRSVGHYEGARFRTPREFRDLLDGLP